MFIVLTRDLWKVTSTILAIYVSYWVLRAAYRLYLHPLARWKGSKVAAVDPAWYEYIWNIRRQGELLFEIERLHKLHGPIIRIGVDELHVNDPDYYLEATKAGSNLLKEPGFYHGISLEGTSIGGTDPKLHRIRRQVLAPAFTASHIQRCASQIEAKLAVLCEALDHAAESKSPLNLKRALKSLTLDVISEMVFGQDFGVMKSEGFRHPFLDILHETIKGAWVFRAFPKLVAFSLALPKSISENLFPIPIEQFAKSCKCQVDTYIEQRSPTQGAGKGTGSSRRLSTILELLLDPSSAKGHTVPTAEELNHEVVILLTAGNDTVSNASILGLYLVCRNSAIRARLETELAKAFPKCSDDIRLEDLKKLPYLSAVVKEVVRFTNPLPGRLPRVIPSEGCTISGQFIPAGTIIHTSAYLLNRNRDVWGDDSYQFSPERWLKPGANELDKYMASFYRGPRQCLGLHLASAELHLIFGTLFRKYNLQIHETSDEDMKWSDHLLVLYKGRDLHVKVEQKA